MEWLERWSYESRFLCILSKLLIDWPYWAIRWTRGIPRCYELRACAVVPPSNQALFSSIDVALNECAIGDCEDRIYIWALHMKVWRRVLVSEDMDFDSLDPRYELPNVVEVAVCPNGVPTRKKFGEAFGRFFQRLRVGNPAFKLFVRIHGVLTFDVRGGLRLAARRPLDGGVSRRRPR